MKKIIYITLLASLSIFPIHAQDAMENLLTSIETNNTKLKALRELSTAQKLENRTSNNLENPELEVTHMPKQRQIGAGTGVEVTQKFDFPTAYRNRGKVIGLQNERIDLAYEEGRRDILYQAQALAIAYIHQIKQLDLVKQRMSYAQELHAAYEKLFEEGNINILERNKTKLNLLDAEKNWELSEVQRNSIQAELERMNGDLPLDIYPSDYSLYVLPLDFDQWFQEAKYKYPKLLMADKSIAMSKEQEQLRRSLNLPKLTAGYVGDFQQNENRHGFLLTVSLPLWQGRNTVKSVKAQTLAMQYEKEDVETQHKNQLREEYEKAGKLKLLLQKYSVVVDNSNNFLLLKKAFDMGQLNLIEYLQELIIYHSAVDNYLSAEKEYNLALLSIKQWNY